MNYFLRQSIELANQRDYLNQLFKVYPISSDTIREVDTAKWQRFEKAFGQKNNNEIIESLLNFELFPIKDSYIAYLRRDKSAIKKNPLTIARICERLKEIGLNKIYNNLSQPKETNRQIGPLFKRWVNSGVLGLKPVGINDFLSINDNVILDASDSVMQKYAKEYLGYEREKGLDFVARFNGKIIMGKAKFLTDFSGHQNAQLEDSLQLLKIVFNENIIKIAILDRVCYTQNTGKMNALICEYKNYNILSVLILCDFLYSLGGSMFRVFQNLQNSKELLQTPYKEALIGDFARQNLLIFDDNLNAMRFLVQEKNYKNSIDLVYIDPPFGINNVFKLGSTTSVAKDSKIPYTDNFNLESYLAFLYPRLILIKEMMSERASLYLHIDSKMGHYVKILCDEVFGRENFINDITRIKCNPKNFKRRAYGNIKDIILLYVKSLKYIWNDVQEQIAEQAPGVTQNGESKQERNDIKPPNSRHWRCSLKELDRLQGAGFIEWSKNNNPRKKVYANEW